MELHQLEYVVAVAKNRSFTRAALEISITPSSLSQQIKKLEDELGVVLFDRTTRTVYVTPAGAELVAMAREVLSNVDDIRTAMRRHIGLESGHIRLGNFPAISYHGIVRLITSFQRTYPGINMDICEDECSNLAQRLESGEIDAAFMTAVDKLIGQKGRDILESYDLISDTLVLLTCRDHPFAGRSVVDLREVADEPFIMPLLTSGASVDFLAACRASGFEPRVKYGSVSNDTRFEFVAVGEGITFSSLKTALANVQSDIAIVPFAPAVPRMLSLAILKKSLSNPSVMTFKNFCVNWANVRNTSKHVAIPSS